MKNKNTITWFEIPADDYERAENFYSKILDIKIHEPDFETHKHKYGLIELKESGVRGAIVEGPDYEPCHKGALVYLNAGNEMGEIMKRIEEYGGKIITGKTEIGSGLGCYSIFMDSEGNKVGLHSPAE